MRNDHFWLDYDDKRLVQWIARKDLDEHIDVDHGQLEVLDHQKLIIRTNNLGSILKIVHVLKHRVLCYLETNEAKSKQKSEFLSVWNYIIINAW